MKKQKGITLVSLIITIAILIIISSLAISQMDDGGMVEIADETKLSLDYKILKKDLGIYKIKKEIATDESLIGIVYKKISVLDTKKELAAIVDFDEINSKLTYGKGAKKLLEEDNNDMTKIKEIDTIYELVDVYAIDLKDGKLYYINSNQIYSDNAE